MDVPISFVVNIMPPRPPANSRSSRAARQKQQEPFETLAVPSTVSETFQDVWDNAQLMWVGYGEEKTRGAYFHKLQNCMHADLSMHITVGSLYSIHTPREERVLYMLQNADDRESSIPDGSHLRPAGWKKRRLSEEQEQQIKRRRLEEERYGVALNELAPYAPVASRESEGAEEGDEPEDEASAHRIDKDGFAIPKRIKKKTKEKRGSGHKAAEAQEEVQVADSQSKLGATQVVPDSVQDDGPTMCGALPDGHVQQETSCPLIPGEVDRGDFIRDKVDGTSRTASSCHQAHSRPQSAPAQKPMSASKLTPPDSRGKTAGLQRHAAQQPSVQKAQQDAKRLRSSTITPNENRNGVARPFSRSSANITIGQQHAKLGPLTPESRPVSSSQEPPESAQRPKPSPAPGTTSARRFKPQRAPPPPQPETDMTLEDPIVDDVLLDGIEEYEQEGLGDEELLGAAEDCERDAERGRTRSRSVESSKGRDTQGLVESGPLNSHAKTPSSVLDSSPNVFEILASSQMAETLRARSESAGQRWTGDEDRKLTKGMRLGPNVPQILSRFNINRSGAAARSRRLYILRTNPELEDPEEPFVVSDDQDNQPSSTPALIRKHWPESDLAKVRRGIADGLDTFEIKAAYFPARSDDSIGKKVKQLEPMVWKAEAGKPDWPQDTVQAADWSGKENSKLRRACLEGLERQEAWKRWFSMWGKHLLRKKWTSYKQQLTALGGARALHSSTPLGPSSSLPSQRLPSHLSPQAVSGTQLSSSPPVQRARDEMTAAQLPQAQPVGTRRRVNPNVVITAEERESARESLSRDGQLQKPFGGNGQTTLNFRCNNRKAADRPSDPSIAEIDAQSPRLSARTRGQQVESAVLPDATETASVQDSDASDENEDGTPSKDFERLEREVAMEMQMDGHFSPVVEVSRPPSQGLDVNNHEPQSPSRSRHANGRFAREHAEFISAQGEAQDANNFLQPETTGRPTNTIRPRTRASAAEVDVRTEVSDSLQTQAGDQLSQELESAAAADHASNGRRDSTVRQGSPSPEGSDEETVAFQTQDPSTTRSQRTSARTANDHRPRRTYARMTAPAQRELTNPRRSRRTSEGSARPCPYDVYDTGSLRELDRRASRAQRRPRTTVAETSAAASSTGPAAGTTTPTESQSSRLPAKSSYAVRMMQATTSPHCSQLSGSTTQSQPSTARSTRTIVRPNWRKRIFVTLLSERDRNLYRLSIARVAHPRTEQDLLDDFEHRKFCRDLWEAREAEKNEEADMIQHKWNLYENELATRKGVRPRNRMSAEHFDGPATCGDFGEADEDVLRTHDGTHKITQTSIFDEMDLDGEADSAFTEGGTYIPTPERKRRAQQAADEYMSAADGDDDRVPRSQPAGSIASVSSPYDLPQCGHIEQIDEIEAEDLGQAATHSSPDTCEHTCSEHQQHTLDSVQLPRPPRDDLQASLHFETMPPSLNTCSTTHGSCDDAISGNDDKLDIKDTDNYVAGPKQNRDSNADSNKEGMSPPQAIERKVTVERSKSQRRRQHRRRNAAERRRESASEKTESTADASAAGMPVPQPQAQPQAPHPRRHVSSRVTPIGETQSTGGLRRPRTRSGEQAAIRGWREGVRNGHIPSPPRPRQAQQLRRARLPFDDEDKDSSKVSSSSGD